MRGGKKGGIVYCGRHLLFASLCSANGGNPLKGFPIAPFRMRGACGTSPGRPRCARTLALVILAARSCCCRAQWARPTYLNSYNRVSPRKNCPLDSFFSPSCASLRITRSVPARPAPESSATSVAAQGLRTRGSRGLLKKAGENFYNYSASCDNFSYCNCQKNMLYLL